jgi:hypothetical protein
VSAVGRSGGGVGGVGGDGDDYIIIVGGRQGGGN